MNDYPELSFKTTEVVVKAKVRPLRTIRDVHYKGLTGKTKTMWAWLRWHSNDNTFSEYLSKPAFKWTVELPTDVYAYHNIDKEAEIEKELNNE